MYGETFRGRANLLNHYNVAFCYKFWINWRFGPVACVSLRPFFSALVSLSASNGARGEKESRDAFAIISAFYPHNWWDISSAGLPRGKAVTSISPLIWRPIGTTLHFGLPAICALINLFDPFLRTGSSLTPARELHPSSCSARNCTLWEILRSFKVLKPVKADIWGTMCAST